MISLGESVVLGMVVWRLWQLLANDFLLDRPRDWLFEHLPDGFGRFVACPFCLTVWIACVASALTTAAHWTTTPFWVLWPASAAVGALIGDWLRRQDEGGS